MKKQTLAAKILKYEEALRFYAKEEHIMASNELREDMDDTHDAPHWLCVGDLSLMIEDGEAARRALKESA